MIRVLLTVLIIAAADGSPTGSRYPQATTLFQCNFDEQADVNFDQWPDVWTRRRGPGFPLYVNVKIQESSGPEGGRSLLFDLDGGAAAAVGPPIAIDPAMACLLEVWVKTDGLKYDRAFASITFLDAKHQPLQTVESDKLGQTAPWTKIRLGPVTPRHDTARFALVGLHLEPEVPERREDLRGKAEFADVWLGRVPRIALSAGGGANLFTDPNRVELTCTTSGFVDPRPVLVLELDNATGQRVAQAQRSVEPVSSPAGGSATKVATGRATWKLPLPGAGFYRVRAQAKGLGALYEQSLTVAVIEPLASGPGSPFGWNLPRGRSPVDLSQLAPLLAQAGLGWVKLPLWYAPSECGKALDPLVSFLDQLQGIEPIGVLDDPPEEVRKRLAGVRPIPAADVFAAAPDTWRASLQPVMSRLAGQVRWWQLGNDRDLSFVDYPDLPAKLQQARTELGRLGGDVNVGIAWGWLNQFPPAGPGPAAWQFLSLSTDPPLSAEELSCYLGAARGRGPLRFVDLEPLPRQRYPLEVRITDLVRRMVAARIHGADAAFIPQPIGGERGLLGDDGTVGELFLPWRTTALLLGRGGYLGSLELPGASTSHLFSRADGAVIAIWNDKPCEEVLYLGERVRQYDLWGRGSAAPVRPQGQAMAVGPLPVFLTGLSEPIARWRMDVELGVRRIKSVYGQPHNNVLRMKNAFAQAVSGRATLVNQEGLAIEPRQIEFRLDPGESFQSPLQITLGSEATSGRHLLRIDFDVQVDRAYRFAAYRSLDVGLGDVYIESRTHLNPRGDLVVEQEFVNTTAQKVTFRCQLLAPGRQLQSSDVLDLAAGRDLRTYLLPKGAELIGGNLWIRAAEVDGPRVLNYRIAAER